MKDLRQELIDFVQWLNTPSYCNDIPMRTVDDYLQEKSINSAQGEALTVQQNEDQKKFCSCGIVFKEDISNDRIHSKCGKYLIGGT